MPMDSIAKGDPGIDRFKLNQYCFIWQLVVIVHSNGSEAPAGVQVPPVVT